MSASPTGCGKDSPFLPDDGKPDSGLPLEHSKSPFLWGFSLSAINLSFSSFLRSNRRFLFFYEVFVFLLDFVRTSHLERVTLRYPQNALIVHPVIVLLPKY